MATLDACSENYTFRKAKENEKKHPELMEQLNEARQKLENLQKAYDEYKF